jgi:pre-mRNA cleavage complex 2 protein Pcf11
LATGETSNGESEDIFVALPSDSAKLNEPCSICMEQFKSVWHVKTQQPVWMDTIKVGDKYYHKSCYDEVRGKKGKASGLRNGESSRESPGPVLERKRKFDGV